MASCEVSRSGLERGRKSRLNESQSCATGGIAESEWSVGSPKDSRREGWNRESPRAGTREGESCLRESFRGAQGGLNLVTATRVGVWKPQDGTSVWVGAGATCSRSWSPSGSLDLRLFGYGGVVGIYVVDAQKALEESYLMGQGCLLKRQNRTPVLLYESMQKHQKRVTYMSGNTNR